MIFYLRQFRFAAVGLALSLGWLRLLADAPLTVALSTPQPLKLGEAVWTDGFFYDRFELCRTQMVPSMGRLMAGTNYTQFLRNFEIAAGLVAGKARGASFNDGDFYKWLEAASATLAVTNDPALHAQLDRIIGIIAQAQRPDGYLDTAVQIRAGGGDTNAIALTDPLKFETYNLGHLFTAACIHHQVTGQSNFLAVAIKAANYLGQAFAQPTPGLAACAICPAHYQGLLDLWQETGDAAYLTLAQQAFALRGLIQDGGDDNQDRVPFARQTEAQGHAVRANYLYTGAAELYRATHETDLWPPLTTIWKSRCSAARSPASARRVTSASACRAGAWLKRICLRPAPPGPCHSTRSASMRQVSSRGCSTCFSSACAATCSVPRVVTGADSHGDSRVSTYFTSGFGAARNSASSSPTVSAWAAPAQAVKAQRASTRARCASALTPASPAPPRTDRN